MAITLSMFRAQVDGLLVASDDELSQLRRERQIKAALERYSMDRPNVVGEDEAGDGGNYYILAGAGAVLAGWVDRFSRVLSIEYPAAVIASDERPHYLSPEDWDDDYRLGSLTYLHLPNHAPASTETMRIRYTAPWAWTKSTTTVVSVTQTAHGFSVSDYVYKESGTWLEATDARLATHQVATAPTADTFTAGEFEADPPVGDFFALCWLAAGLCAQAIADKYSRTADSTLSVDAVDHLSRAQEWSRRARELIGLYEEHLNIGAAATDTAGKPAGEFVDWDTRPAQRLSGSYAWLFHGD